MGSLSNVLAVLSCIFFVVAIKRLGKVRTARQGNAIAALGMLLAVVAILLKQTDVNWAWVIAGVVVGSAIGVWAAKTVQMTGMPEMVALFNGSGGIASAMVAIAYFFLHSEKIGATMGGADPVWWSHDGTATLMLSILIGGLTLTGSIVAYAKLAGRITSAPILLPARHLMNIGLVAAAIAVAILAGWVAPWPWLMTILLFLLLAIAFVLGVTLVVPIGGADMPVVISLLNSYSGVAASMTGFVLKEPVLIIAGALVGAAGLILTQLMCKAMNRSLANVLFGGFGVADSTGTGGGGDYTTVKEAGPEEAAMILEDAQSVVFVPGYGLAVAQAQHACQQLANMMEERGANVTHAIHPVAGRMPGHMNVLLAEADVPYDKLIEMDDINPEFKNTDVAIVLGANDVVNPAALTDKSSPIYGMPILTVHEARTVFVVKRSLSPGFAGIRNELFENDNSLMIFGDAKDVLQKLIEELKNA
ncbi:MAG: NAD(P)(+) transhydrogenase (Re/Si-specific) subunit beta [Planctomycetota bacterium]